MLTVGSLFTGIGGFDLGLERAGMRVLWQCESDDFCRRVLARHWPGVPCYPDVCELDAGTPAVTLLAGGFPCQPVSDAGLKLGQDDERWLWPEFARAIRLLRPSYVLVENVPGLLGRGFSEVLGDLAASGYDAEWDCLPAAAFGAPHIRDRVWLIAYPIGEQHQGSASAFRWPTPEELSADSDQERRNGWTGQLGAEGRSQPADVGQDADEFALRTWRVGGRAAQAGGSEWWATEPPVGRVAHGVPDRLDQLAALGNALVPQIAEWIGRRIIEWEAVNVA